jgi:hypothetical protein
MIASKIQISKLWNIQENEKTFGVTKRLYSSEIKYKIYSTYQYPENFYGIAFSFDKSIKLDVSDFDNLRDLKVLLLEDGSYRNNNILIIELLYSGYKDIFAVLCDNLVHAVMELDSEKSVAKSVINQLCKWKTLFSRSISEGLSNQEQHGLFGELVFLQKMLDISAKDENEILKYWVGPEFAVRDFQGENWAVEVKTTSSNNPQKIKINGERQLDENFLSNLFLCHCSVECSRNNGISLNKMIDEIRNRLSSNIVALNQFNTKLFEVGYLDEHAYKYKESCYKLRTLNLYHVKGDFPRIKESELRNGVFEVVYSITLSMCDEYLISENDLFSKLL